MAVEIVTFFSDGDEMILCILFGLKHCGFGTKNVWTRALHRHEVEGQILNK